MCCFSKHSLHVTNKAVDVTLPRRFVNDVFVVVVAQATTQLLIVHFWLVLTLAPPLRHLEDTRENLNQPLRPLQSNQENVKMSDVKITNALLLTMFVCTFVFSLNYESYLCRIGHFKLPTISSPANKCVASRIQQKF